MFPRQRREWLELDIAWLEKCDIVLRIPGKSEGADEEVRQANLLGITVVHTIEQARDVGLALQGAKDGR
jgi:hypothetical protein